MSSTLVALGPVCEHCGTTDPDADVLKVSESMYWLVLCDCCRVSLKVGK